MSSLTLTASVAAAAGESIISTSISIATATLTQALSTSTTTTTIAEVAPSALSKLGSAAAKDVVPSEPATWLGLLARFILFILKAIPLLLYWVITFTTLTLPSWLFTMFSTSLTFTLNATTV